MTPLIIYNRACMTDTSFFFIPFEFEIDEKDEDKSIGV